ncbi:TrkA family potassium uptake protein [Caldifermentibacillus hisashii]|uniref:potassium channel family protein n=1 Tax=Caldifermentibacillus hisashii TaxID=996558 RepID=UPI0031B6D7A4
MVKNKKRESFGVIGLGRFGLALAKALAKEGKDVIAIDSDENKIKEVRNDTEYAYVVSELTKAALQETGIQNCDAVIVCIGKKIDTSILTTLNVVSLGVPKVIAKANTYEHGLILEKLGAEVVYPEHDMAVRLAKRLLTNNVLDYIMLSDDIEISELTLTDKLIGESVADINIRKKLGLNIIAIMHNGKTITNIEPEYQFEKGDVMVVIGNRKNIEQFEDYLLK